MRKPMEHNISNLNYPVDVVLDTDTFNEVDDQFALAYLLCLQDKVRVRAITAAPFHNQRSSGPEDGMLKSYNEILRVLSLMGREDLKDRVFLGSRSYMKDENTPEDSPAAREIIRLAKEHTPENPLYIVGIACITNVASAFLLCPEIAKNTSLIWLAGHSKEWEDAKDFNIRQDYAASRSVFDSDTQLIEIPCMGVADRMNISGPELDAFFRGKNRLCDYLAERVEAEVRTYNASPVWTRTIWDVTAIGYFIEDAMWS
ncbi:MAG: nucleoside hydrolase, partial [Clostridia bacterium]|nr:nucleoside hydrolase [Clostridia bacterium]